MLLLELQLFLVEKPEMVTVTLAFCFRRSIKKNVIRPVAQPFKMVTLALRHPCTVLSKETTKIFCRPMLSRPTEQNETETTGFTKKSLKAPVATNITIKMTEHPQQKRLAPNVAFFKPQVGFQGDEETVARTF